MARSTIERVTCDRCVRLCRDDNYATVHLVVDRTVDENACIEEVQETVELCSDCLGKCLTQRLAELPLPARVGWLTQMREAGRG